MWHLMHSGLKRMTLTKPKSLPSKTKAENTQPPRVQRVSWLGPGGEFFTSKGLGIISVCSLICPLALHSSQRCCFKIPGASNTVSLRAEELALRGGGRGSPEFQGCGFCLLRLQRRCQHRAVVGLGNRRVPQRAVTPVEAGRTQREDQPLQDPPEGPEERQKEKA